MKKILLIAMPFLVFNSWSQAPTIEWQRSYGGTGMDNAKEILQTEDGGFAILGGSESADIDVSGNYGLIDIWLLKIDAAGDIEWEQHFGGSNYDNAFDMAETADGGFILAGFTTSNDYDITETHGAADAWLIKIAPGGAVQWQKTFGGTGSEQFYGVAVAGDGSFMACGYSNSSNGDLTQNNGGDDLWVVKVDPNGALLWQKTFGGTAEDYANSVAATADDGCIIAGKTNSNNGDIPAGSHKGGSDCWILKLDAAGTVQWQKNLGGSGAEIAFDIRGLSDGNYVFLAHSSSLDGDVTGGHGQTDLWIVKLDGSGNIFWSDAIGGSAFETACRLDLTSDSGLVVVGTTGSTNGDPVGCHLDESGFNANDIWPVKLSPTGVLQWQKPLGGLGCDTASAIIATSDNGYLVAGGQNYISGDITSHYGAGDIWLVKLMPDALQTDSFSRNEVIVYPNPVSEWLSISVDGQALPEKIGIYDVTGKLVLSGSDASGISVQSLAAGLYVLEAVSGHETQHATFIKQ
jgi:hypothetical protein